jgi:TolB-like protein
MLKKNILFVFLALIAFNTVFSQAVTIDTALENSTSYLNGRITAGSKVVVLNFTSNWPQLSEYIIDELIGYIVNEGTLTVVDRSNLEMIRRELNFQLSGEVSDATAQSIGQMLGAQTIISGAITPLGSSYRLRVRAISVETAHILGMYNVDVAQDSRLAALTGTAFATPTGSTTIPTTPRDGNYSGTWRIVARNGMHIHVQGNKIDNNAAIIIWPAAGGANSQWSFERQSDGTFFITNVHSNKVMDVSWNSKDNGAQIIQYGKKSSSNDNQRWRIVDVGNGFVKFINVLSGSCLTIPNNTKNRETQLVQWQDNGSESQHFKLERVN